MKLLKNWDSLQYTAEEPYQICIMPKLIRRALNLLRQTASLFSSCIQRQRHPEMDSSQSVTHGCRSLKFSLRHKYEKHYEVMHCKIRGERGIQMNQLVFKNSVHRIYEVDAGIFTEEARSNQNKQVHTSTDLELSGYV